MRANQQARIKVSNTQFSRFWRLKWGKLFIGTQGKRTKSDAKNPGDFSFWHIWCLYCIFWYKNRTPFLTKIYQNQKAWKLSWPPKKDIEIRDVKKISHFHFLISNVLGTLSRASSKLNYGKCKEKQPLWELFAFFVWPLSLDGVPKKNFSMQSLFPWYFLMFTPYQNLLFLTLDFSLEKKFCELICIDLFKKSGIYSSRFLQGVVTASSTPKNDFIHVLHKLKRAFSSPSFFPVLLMNWEDLLKK